MATTLRSHGHEGVATGLPPRALRLTVVAGDVVLLHLPVGRAVEAVAKLPLRVQRCPSLDTIWLAGLGGCM